VFTHLCWQPPLCTRHSSTSGQKGMELPEGSHQGQANLAELMGLGSKTSYSNHTYNTLQPQVMLPKPEQTKAGPVLPQGRHAPASCHLRVSQNVGTAEGSRLE
jgi:hypothetical protein